MSSSELQMTQFDALLRVSQDGQRLEVYTKRPKEGPEHVLESDPK